MSSIDERLKALDAQFLPELQSTAAAVLKAVDVDGLRDRRGAANGADDTALSLAKSIVWYVAEPPSTERHFADGTVWNEGFAGLDNVYMALQFATSGTEAYPAVLEFVKVMNRFYDAVLTTWSEALCNGYAPQEAIRRVAWRVTRS